VDRICKNVLLVVAAGKRCIVCDRHVIESYVDAAYLIV